MKQSIHILGDSIGYELGRHLGQERLLQHGHRFGLRQEHLDRVDGFFVRHGGKAVFGSHFLHLLRALMPLVAGARRMRYLKFLLFIEQGVRLRESSRSASGGWMSKAGGQIRHPQFRHGPPSAEHAEPEHHHENTKP